MSVRGELSSSRGSWRSTRGEGCNQSGMGRAEGGTESSQSDVEHSTREKTAVDISPSSSRVTPSVESPPCAGEHHSFEREICCAATRCARVPWSNSPVLQKEATPPSVAASLPTLTLQPGTSCTPPQSLGLGSEVGVPPLTASSSQQDPLTFAVPMSLRTLLGLSMLTLLPQLTRFGGDQCAEGERSTTGLSSLSRWLDGMAIRSSFTSQIGSKVQPFLSFLPSRTVE